MDKKEYYSKFIEENKDKLKHMFDESITYDEFLNYINDNNLGWRILFNNSYYITSNGEIYFNDGNKLNKVVSFTLGNNKKLFVSLLDYTGEFRFYSLSALVVSCFMFNGKGYKTYKNCIGYYDNDCNNCKLHNLYVFIV